MGTTRLCDYCKANPATQSFIALDKVTYYACDECEKASSVDIHCECGALFDPNTGDFLGVAEMGETLTLVLNDQGHQKLKQVPTWETRRND